MVAASPQCHELLAGKERGAPWLGRSVASGKARQVARTSWSITRERITTTSLSDRYQHGPRSQPRAWNSQAVEPLLAQVPDWPRELRPRIS